VLLRSVRTVIDPLECQANSVDVKKKRGHFRYDAIVAQFLDFLARHPKRPMPLAEICAAIDVAERTLRAACEEQLGMGPIRFLTLRRMHLARAALIRSDANATSVTRIATDYGFWELGRFSVSYRALFGELPSETLRRPAERCPIHLNRPSSLPAKEVTQHMN